MKRMPNELGVFLFIKHHPELGGRTLFDTQLELVRMVSSGDNAWKMPAGHIPSYISKLAAGLTRLTENVRPGIEAAIHQKLSPDTKLANLFIKRFHGIIETASVRKTKAAVDPATKKVLRFAGIDALVENGMVREDAAVVADAPEIVSDYIKAKAALQERGIDADRLDGVVRRSPKTTELVVQVFKLIK